MSKAFELQGGFDSRIEQLNEASKEVLLGSIATNGAIMAADLTHPAYPREVKGGYNNVWPSDVAFTLAAVERIDAGAAHDMRDRFLDWLMDRAEGFSETGMLWQRYNLNGARESKSYGGNQFKVDQMGALIWGLHESTPQRDLKADLAISKLASAICEVWAGDHFKLDIYDRWEERLLKPEDRSVFTYSLATCIYGLRTAAFRLDNYAFRDEWREVADQMEKLVASISTDHIPRTVGDVEDDQIDALAMGAMWPFNSAVFDQYWMFTDMQIEKKLKIPPTKTKPGNTIGRYEGDTYSNKISGGIEVADGAGGWPLLDFWHVLARPENASRESKLGVFVLAVDQLRYRYIPEQVFVFPDQKSISPLVWSHAMYTFAADELDYL